MHSQDRLFDLKMTLCDGICYTAALDLKFRVYTAVGGNIAAANIT